MGSFLSGFSCFVRNVREPPGNQTMPFLLGEQIFLALFEREDLLMLRVLDLSFSKRSQVSIQQIALQLLLHLYIDLD